ncbi:hypothetical protein Saut_0600 [Sulfurimonas autotrophica DSM 16294]|uniref:Uncharacterized protein n=2 Tax=Sulfurimonas autotrophica TaxID=202747 RepID=E0UPQ7_SULAO|nr:hypothetical protein Saut_0600 [Sulfurimonas autotrophica DSM 16294]
MLKKLFNKQVKKLQDCKQEKEILTKVAKMDIYDMHNYLKDGNTCEIGIDAIIKKILQKDTKENRRFVEIYDAKYKVGKCFDLILNILEYNNITKKTLSLIDDFLFLYSDLIREYDEKYEDKYQEKLKNALFFRRKDFE